MALACNSFWTVDYSSSSYEKSSSYKLSSWPLSQVAPLSSSSKYLRRSQYRNISVACAGRVSESQEAGPSSLTDDRQGTSLTSHLVRDAARSPPSEGASGIGFAPESSFSSQVPASLQDGSASPFMQASQNSSKELSMKVDEQVGVQVQDDDDEEEWMKGFPGAKGALVKTLSPEKLKHFAEGYLDTVKSIERLDWVTVVPMPMLPKGDRLVLEHNKESVIVLWFQGRIYALENRSPAAPLFEEGFAKAVVSEDGLITCPVTGSKFDIRTGAAIEWLPNSSFLEKLFTPVFNDLSIYAVRASPDHLFINKEYLLVGGYYPLAEFTGNRIWTGPDYEEPIIFDDLEFGFTEENELTNGRFAMLGFLTLLILEMTTGEGILKGSGILDFLYKFLPGFPLLRY
ncbi:hypothetical protein GOP47_0005989 [Adiantum capillus-veneris]|uniref:Rieske-like [2Fe-2S] domain-containing protein n=1 Tax=Adiantum capillus-veneris TaxID=13818 RepID=A0A9D4V2Z3_ADICA|nr:hypothetical protein GOP47_0005989 [Adiantum capillus-veneris]